MNLERQKTILLVEDEAIIAMAEKMILEKFGYRVLAVHRGEEAVAAVKDTPAIDLILMDIDLGKGMDGTEAAALILAHRDLPVVFLSSHMEPEIVAKTEKITSYGYVVKNSSSTVLDASIKMAFKLFEAKVREKEKEAALAHSRGLMQYVIEHMSSAVAVHDRDLRYIYVSQRYLDEYRLKERDIIGKSHYDVFPDLPQKWRDVHQRALAGEISRAENDSYERADGSVEWTRWECRPWYEADGAIGGIIVYTEVTSERKLAELKLAQNLDMITKLARLVPGVIYQYRLYPDGRSAFPYASPGMNDIYEVTPEEVREDATPVFARLHPDDYDRVAGAIQASALTLNTFLCEFRVLLPRQGLRWRWSQAHPERLPDGGTLWHGIISDITERKLAEEALRASEERHRAIFDFSPYAILLTSPDGRILAANSAACRLFEMTEEEIKGRGRSGILDVADPRLPAALAERERTGKFHGELTFIRKNGGRFAGEVATVIFKDKDGDPHSSMIIRDITTSKQAEEELRATEERWRDILFSMADWVWEVDANGVYTYSSEKGERILGYSRQEIIGKTPFDFMPPEEAARVGPIFGEIASRKEIVRDLENWNLDKSGKRICLLTNGVPILDPQGNLLGYRGVDRDITERKLAEDRMKSALSFQQALLDAVPSPIFYKDADFAYIGGNKAFERYIGLTREQFVGKTVHDIAPADLAERYDRADRELLKKPGVQTYEGVVVYADGTRHDVIFNKAIFNDAEGRAAGMIGVILDISERKRAEAALQENNSRLELAMQAADMAWWEMDLPSGRVSFAKRKAEMLGYPAEKFKHYRDFVDLLHPDDREKALAAMRGHLDGSLPRYEVDYRIATRSGEYVWFHDIGSIGKRDADSKPLNVTGLVINISARKLAEEALRLNEAKQAKALQMTKAGHWEYDVDNDRFTFNDNFYRIFHTTAAAVGGYQMSAAEYARRFCHPDDAAQVGAETRAAIASSDPDYSRQVEHRILYADGGIGHIAVRFFIVKDPKGRTIKTYGVNQDISERKRAEQALQESINDFRGYFNMGTVGMCVTSPTASWIEVNDRLCSMLGYSREELLGKNWIDLTHADDADADLELFREVLAGRRDAYELEKRFVRKDGRIIHTRLYATCQRNPDRSVRRFLASLVDITEQKQAEQAVLESKERYEGFIAQSSDGVYRLEMDVPMPLDLPLEEQIDHMYHHLRIAECNPAFLAMYGMQEAAEILGKSLLDMHGGVDNPVNRQTSRQFVLSGYRIQHAVTEEVDTRGKRKHFSNNSIGILENGRLTRMWGTQTDISERVQMEAERRALQKIVQGVLASGSLREFLGLVHGTIAKVVYAENFFVALYNKVTGLFEQAYISDKFDASFPPSKLEKSASSFVFRSGRPLLASREIFAAMEARGELELVGTDSPSWLGVPLITGDETIGVMVVQDYEQENRYTGRDLEFFVSIAGQVALAVEHKRTSEEVKRQLEEKSILLKEVHHRIKNNFASIAGLLSLHMQTSASPEAVAALQDAIGRIDSMRLLYEKLLLGGDFQDASAKNYVESLAASVVSLFPDQAKVKLSLEVDDFKLDPKRLFPLGIILNELLTNIMKYAFAGKKSGAVKLTLAKAGNRVTLTLQDDGNGIPEGLNAAEAKGFGLMLVNMLAQQLQGSFTIEKQKGTRCTVIFEV